ncbi:hypothetical protein XELAEV_18017863mg [Xenopus laevis]|uniref:Uncharacterized protein n=1 Tax=Xenopus laevis TaxID=8355 RepID=A0A974DBX9_XENLA|nr:hypothetical protein XELAEV_18017863mg [Xenopus laevis]
MYITLSSMEKNFLKVMKSFDTKQINIVRASYRPCHRVLSLFLNSLFGLPILLFVLKVLVTAKMNIFCLLRMEN